MVKTKFILAFIVFLLPRVLSAQQVLKNVLSNQYFGFEAGGDGWWVQHPDNWKITNEMAASGSYSIKFSSETDVSSSLKIHGGDENFDGSRLNLEPGTYTMKLKVWLDSAATINEFQTTIKTPWKNITWSFEGIEKGKWVELSKEIVLSEAVVDSKILLVANSGKGVFFIDDIEIWGYVEEEKPLIPYISSIETTGNNTVELDAGKYEMKLKVWIEFETTISKFNTILNETWQLQSWDTSGLAKGEWIELSQNIDLPENINSGIKIEIPNNTVFGGGAGTFFIDDIVFENVITSLQAKKENQQKIKVYPNPFRNELNVSVSANHSFESIKLIDICGRIVMQQDVKHEMHEIVLNTGHLNLPKGIYVLRIFGKQNSIQQKLIKK